MQKDFRPRTGGGGGVSSTAAGSAQDSGGAGGYFLIFPGGKERLPLVFLGLAFLLKASTDVKSLFEKVSLLFP